MASFEELNRNINRLYRQLGKLVYEKEKGSNLDEKIGLLISKLDEAVAKIEAFSEPKVILSPETNEDGIGLYKFCKNCRVGNNPKSTHCVQCGEKLS